MILTKDSVEEVVRREAGGKGYNLYLLTKAKYNVPAWTIISADLFRQYITDNDISTRIQDLLQNITRGLTSTTTASKRSSCSSIIRA